VLPQISQHFVNWRQTGQLLQNCLCLLDDDDLEIDELATRTLFARTASSFSLGVEEGLLIAHRLQDFGTLDNPV
jgi:hypothetical protein